MLSRRVLLAAMIALTGLSGGAIAQDKSIVVSSTTSTTDSGLFNHLLPLFKQKTGIDVKVVSQGTGQALDTGRRGDSDVVFVHAKAQEEKFVADGFGVKRYPVMYNDFVLIGPKSDPVGIKGAKNVTDALKKIRAKAAPFISRGDRSGTHAAELDLWKVAGIDIAKEKGAKTLGDWYKEIGQGMGAALNTASASDAYVLSDRASWINFKNRGALGIMVEGDPPLFNQYAVMLVSPEKHKHVKQDLGQAFVNWIVSPEGQKAIADFRINGQQLFFPNAAAPGA